MGEQDQDVVGKRKGFGPRLGALLIDTVFTIIGGVVVGVVLGGTLGALAGSGAAANEGLSAEEAEAAAVVAGVLGGLFGIILGVALFAILYGLIEAFSGASPGKMLIGMKIANADGTAASIGKFFGRYAIKNVAMLLALASGLTGVAALNTVGGLLGLVVFVGCFFALGSAKQALHDSIVGSAVYAKADVR